LGDWLADIVTGTPVTAPEHLTEEEKKEAEEKVDETAVEEEEDPIVEPKRPVYLLQHHPSQRNIKEPDLKLYAPLFVMHFLLLILLAVIQHDIPEPP
jgi:hypothetical protein